MGSFEAIDFPAAHSMDTAWFAVDRDGHVAMFSTGESGAAPTAAYVGEDYFGLIDSIKEAIPKKECVRDLAGLLRSSGAPHLRTPHSNWSVIVFLREANEQLDAVGAHVVPSTEGVAFIVPDAVKNKSLLDELHARDLCLGCFLDVTGEEDTDVAEHGVFRYEQSTDNWIAGPYALVARPGEPVDIEALPPEIAEHAIVYEGTFGDGKAIQPAEIWKSDSWGAAWLASDGKTVRPFPGRLSEMEEEVAALGEEEDLVVVREALDVPDGRTYASTRRPETKPATKKPWWKLW